IVGPPPMPTPTTTEGPTGSGTISGTGTTTSLDTTLVLEGTSSGGTTTTATTTTEGTSTGSACGQALGTCDALDLLFVIDNSGSMMEDNGVLIPALASVQELLVSQLEGVCSYHIGVTTTEPALDFPAQAGCEVRGALSRGGVLCPDGPWDDPEHVPWVSEHDDIQSLGCLFGVMQEQDDDEKQLDTILAAVGEELGAPGGCNEGFVRDGVPLIVVLVTDEDDDDDSSTPGEDPDRTGSALAPEDWWEALTAIKAPADLSMVLLASTNPGTCSFTPEPGSSDGTGAAASDTTGGSGATGGSGGCGCRSDRGPTPGPVALVLVALGLLGRRRRGLAR
ncbi:MAG: hypothetical protein KDK70_32070, partial [Myxococcales bacterium]|nr:hypothetical protein [Myxococcales bacterium]